MSALWLILGGIVLFIVAYITYGAWLARQWGIDPSRPTPAHTKRDDIDYCPAKAPVLLGHHFASIAGAGPITGPIAASFFGWVPVALWIIVGS
ncbi:MAG: carbon starvation protein A, partial [Peptococcaceae bacterium]|nr:carbon starvation protein A [Peptococcaceae bacterium]